MLILHRHRPLTDVLGPREWFFKETNAGSMYVLGREQ